MNIFIKLLTYSKRKSVQRFLDHLAVSYKKNFREAHVALLSSAGLDQHSISLLRTKKQIARALYTQAKVEAFLFRRGLITIEDVKRRTKVV